MVCAAFLLWIVLLWALNKALGDGGPKVDNNVLRPACDHVVIMLYATAAQVQWSNGVRESYNAVIKNTFAK